MNLRKWLRIHLLRRRTFLERYEAACAKAVKEGREKEFGADVYWAMRRVADEVRQTDPEKAALLDEIRAPLDRERGLLP